MTDTPASVTLVQRPMLPTHADLTPYLERIDETRWYSNRGPLLWELEERLQHHFGIARHAVMMMASGSAALEAAILAHVGPASPERPLALMPSFTFVATAQSVRRCGYEPYFLDVDPETWMLDPAHVLQHPKRDQAGVIVPVAAYGRRPDMAAWEAIQRETGCQVVVDAAAAFEQFERFQGLISETVPAVLSMHATKTFSTAEGGAILLSDHQEQIRASQVSNFGLNDARQCEYEGLNGKLSEFHAAVGLAQLDNWATRKAQIATVAGHYREGAAEMTLPGRFHLSPDIGGAYVLFEADSAETADRLIRNLMNRGLGVRRWYGAGLHKTAVFDDCGRDDLTVTDHLNAVCIGLPAAVDLSQEDVNTVLAAIADP